MSGLPFAPPDDEQSNLNSYIRNLPAGMIVNDVRLNLYVARVQACSLLMNAFYNKANERGLQRTGPPPLAELKQWTAAFVRISIIQCTACSK
jgi:hypothetical protein